MLASKMRKKSSRSGVLSFLLSICLISCQEEYSGADFVCDGLDAGTCLVGYTACAGIMDMYVDCGYLGPGWPSDHYHRCVRFLQANPDDVEWIVCLAEQNTCDDFRRELDPDAATVCADIYPEGL
jgi:hypothetical protein